VLSLRPGQYSAPLGELTITDVDGGLCLCVKPLGGMPSMSWVFRPDGVFDHFVVETPSGPSRGVRCAVGCRHISPSYAGKLWLLPPITEGGLPQLGCDACVVESRRKLLRDDDPRRSIISEDLLLGLLARCEVCSE